jgi:hypothetical protein
MKAYKGGKASANNQNTDPNLLRTIQQMEKETGHTITPNNSETKYSEMLLDLIEPFYDKNFFVAEELQAVLELGTIAWNIANMKKLVPQAYKMMLQETKNDLEGDKETISMLDKMIQQKLKKYNRYEMFIHKADVNFTPEGELYVTATAKSFEVFVADSMEEKEEDDDDRDEQNFKPGYINRSAFTLMPKQPFIAWKQNLEGNLFPAEKIESSIYLIRDMSTDEEKEAWLQKKFDSIFQQELASWYGDEKQWPKKRTYQMFREWFDISFQSFIYDVEDYPVDKDAD